MRIVVIAITLIACATTPPPPPTHCVSVADVQQSFNELVTDASLYMPVTQWCAGTIIAIHMVSGAHEMDAVCQRGKGMVVGCSAQDHRGFEHVWVVKCQREPYKTIRMERMHALLRCALGDADREHRGEIWDDLDLR